MQKQVTPFTEKLLSPYLCGHKKGFSTDWKMEKKLEQKGYGAAVLMDLSKVFDTLNHDLLQAKLHAYGFDRGSLKILHSCLSNKYQRTKTNKGFSSCSITVFGVPQGSVFSVFDPFNFNIYINDLFWMAQLTDICSFADDTTFYVYDSSLEDIVNRVEHDVNLAIEWFDCNYVSSCYFWSQIWSNLGKT